jgi:glycosyltransferase involved in cell wall biosynthesis
MTSPRFSIVMPTYRRTTYLREAIESALGQTTTDFELIVGDNSPDDAVGTIVRSYSDPRIAYQRHEVSLGAQGNWLWGVRAARSDVVATLHDDDAWLPHFLEEVAEPLACNSDLAAAFCDITLVDHAGVTLDRYTERNTDAKGRRHLATGRLNIDQRALVDLTLSKFALQMACGGAFRRELVVDNEFADSIDPLYDLWLNYYIARSNQPIYYCAQRLTRYRMHGDQLTAATRHNVDREIHSYDLFAADPELRPWRPELLARRDELRVTAARRLLLAGDDQGARELLGSVPEADISDAWRRTAKLLKAPYAGRLMRVRARLAACARRVSDPKAAARRTSDV